MAKYPSVDPGSLTREGLLSMIDYTMLKPEETLRGYTKFIKAAAQWGFHAVFVPPCYVPVAVGMLSSTPVMVGTPVSFPFGYSDPDAKAAEALSALEEGASELDVVMNVSAALSGEWEIVEEDLSEVVSTIRAWEKSTLGGPVTVKVILETPYLDREQKIEACRVSVAAGADFVKTATGLGPGGATVEDVKLMRQVVGEGIGVKASGGIRTWFAARDLIAAGASRIGTSTGPELVEEFLGVKGK
jgi:deoxyribose-phosphate aldolase